MSSARRTFLACLTLGLLLPACGDDAAPGPNVIAERPECENLNPDHCMLPWPSSRFLAADSSTATGYRIAVTADALPRNQFDEPIEDLQAWNNFDGFSPMSSMMTTFRGPLDTSGLPDEAHIADSLATSSPTIILDAESGSLVAHFSEVDTWPNADPVHTSFYIRPAARLAENHRYIVAIRNLRRTDGTAVEPSEYFRALRDGLTTDVAELEARRASFQDIFGKLATAGVERAGLIEAWDFHTASGASAWGEPLWMRDDAQTRVGARGLGCTVTEVREDVNAETWRLIRGTFTVPLYMDDAGEGTRARRDASGHVAFNTMTEAPFVVAIPYSVRDSVMSGGAPARMLMYGHGLLGTADQVNSGGTRVLLQRAGIVGIGTDFWGMAEPDEGWFINNVIGLNFGKFFQMSERIMQGAINSVVLARSFRGVCSELAELQLDVGGTPMPLVDTSQLYYYGISQGGIFGATVAGLSNDIERFALQVGAISYPTLIRRSLDFKDFENVYELWYRDKLDRDFFLVSIANAWDLTDPATYAPHLLANPLAGTTAKRILLQTSRYDSEVSNVASDIGARTMGLRLVPSSVYTPWNVQPATLPSDSGYVIYHLHDVAPIPMGSTIAPADNNAHSDLRFQDPVLDQLDMFLRPDGQIQDTCPAGSCEITNTHL